MEISHVSSSAFVGNQQAPQVATHAHANTATAKTPLTFGNQDVSLVRASNNEAARQIFNTNGQVASQNRSTVDIFA